MDSEKEIGKHQIRELPHEKPPTQHLDIGRSAPGHRAQMPCQESFKEHREGRGKPKSAVPAAVAVNLSLRFEMHVVHRIAYRQSLFWWLA